MVETEQKIFGIVRPPESCPVKEPLVVTVSLEHLDPSFIEDIVVFQSARDSLVKEVRGLATEDFMKEHAMISMPRGKNRIRTLTMAGGGRTVPVAYGVIPYNDRIIGSTVSEKGILSGNILHFQNITSDSKDPWGFFGRKEAVFENKILSRLRDAGMRTSLPLGYVVLKDNLLRDYMMSAWKKAGNDRIAQLIEKGLTIVRKNNDYPVLMFRVVDMEDRIDRDELCLGWIWSKLRAHRQQYVIAWENAAIAHMSGLFEKEALLFPHSFQNYLVGTNLSRKNVIAMLHAMTSRSVYSHEQFLHYLKFLKGIIASNSRALKQALMSSCMTQKYFPQQLGWCLRKGGDVTLGMMHLDVEQIRRNPPCRKIKEELDEYNQGMSFIIYYFNEMWKKKHYLT